MRVVLVWGRSSITLEQCFFTPYNLKSYLLLQFFVSGTGLSGQNRQAGRGGWALPSTERSHQSGRVMMDARDRAGPSGSQQSTRMKGSTDFKDKSSHSQGKQRK